MKMKLVYEDKSDKKSSQKFKITIKMDDKTGYELVKDLDKIIKRLTDL